jgi:hypothetical protein
MSDLRWLDLHHSFHITLHAEPPGDWSRRPVTLEGFTTESWDIPSPKLDCPMPVSFEEACSALSELPRLHIEPDGSFVWVSARDAVRPWQVDGMLYDRGGRLLYVELKGRCPAFRFVELLTAFGCLANPCVVQLVRYAVVMDVSEFCRMKCDF